MAISEALEWMVDQWVVVLTGLVFVYNFLFHNKEKQLIACCLTVVLMYSLGHFVLAWINDLSWSEQIYYRYSSRLMIYVLGSLFLSAIVIKTGPSLTTSVVFANFLIAIILQLALHIDRNIIGLNQLDSFLADGTVIVNRSFKQYWGLWDWYTIILNLSSGFLIGYLLLCEFVKERLCSRFS